MSDLIRRQDAIKAVANYLWHYPNEQYKNLNVFEVGESLVKDALSIVPSADAVSRDDLIKAYEKGLQAQVVDLTESRPTGEWKQVDLLADRLCSVCGYGVWDSEAEEYNFCPNCGAKMGGDDE